jgi:Ca2+-binding EF-hand superfamily protein
MKNYSIKSILATAGLVLAATSPVFGGEAKDAFKRMDTDGNGKVTAAENAAFAETMFKQADTNYDGQVSAAECDSAQASHGNKVDQKASARHLQIVDTDHSGQISASENAAFAKSEFARADKNGDGVLSEDEVEAQYKAMKKEMKD